MDDLKNEARFASMTSRCACDAGRGRSSPCLYSWSPRAHADRRADDPRPRPEPETGDERQGDISRATSPPGATNAAAAQPQILVPSQAVITRDEHLRSRWRPSKSAVSTRSFEVTSSAF